MHVVHIHAHTHCTHSNHALSLLSPLPSPLSTLHQQHQQKFSLCCAVLCCAVLCCSAVPCRAPDSVRQRQPRLQDHSKTKIGPAPQLVSTTVTSTSPVDSLDRQTGKHTDRQAHTKYICTYLPTQVQYGHRYTDSPHPHNATDARLALSDRPLALLCSALRPATSLSATRGASTWMAGWLWRRRCGRVRE